MLFELKHGKFVHIPSMAHITSDTGSLELDMRVGTHLLDAHALVMEDSFGLSVK